MNGNDFLAKKHLQMVMREHGPQIARDERTYINEHGVQVVIRHIGRCFCSWYGVRASDGKVAPLRWSKPEDYYSETFEVVNDVLDVPVICLECQHYDPGEFGDFGDMLGGPLCGINLHFPTKKGTCKRRKA